MAQTDFDLIIVGGGMVGACLAIALKNTSLRIALVETSSLQSDQQPSYDDRGIALAYGSQRILDTMGIWSQLAAHSCPITHIHVSDRGHFGATRLSAEQEQVPALGQVITARAFGHQLNSIIQQQENLKLFCPLSVTDLLQADDHITITLSDTQQLSSRLLVAADGRQSTVRQLLNLGAYEYDYQQTAITANLTAQRPHNNWAYERFTDTGPIAMLPMSDNRCSLVWTVQTGDEKALLALDEQAFLQQLQQRFGYRLGKLVRVGQRQSYPLILTQAEQPVQQRVVLLGNAAHSLHPIAGQGFNLGLRDVAVLADLLASHTEDCGDMRVLSDYQYWRQQDQDNVIRATDNLVKLFSNADPLIGHLRAAGLSLLDKLPIAKHWLAASSMGLKGKQPRLARGIKL